VSGVTRAEEEADEKQSSAVAGVLIGVGLGRYVKALAARRHGGGFTGRRFFSVAML